MTDWTNDVLLEHLRELRVVRDARADERNADLRREIERIDREFHEHLAGVRDETAAALQAADKAISKSEAATEKRFDSVNEFRAQLADQAATFMPRRESEQRTGTNTEKIETLAARLDTAVSTINSRLDMMAGQASGKSDSWGYLVGLVGVASAVVAAVIGLNR